MTWLRSGRQNKKYVQLIAVSDTPELAAAMNLVERGYGLPAAKWNHSVRQKHESRNEVISYGQSARYGRRIGVMLVANARLTLG